MPYVGSPAHRLDFSNDGGSAGLAAGVDVTASEVFVEYRENLPVRVVGDIDDLVFLTRCQTVSSRLTECRVSTVCGPLV
jgi:hypothetical protein